MNTDVVSEITVFLDIHDSIALLRTCSILYFSEALWKVVLLQWSSVGTLACPPKSDFMSLSFDQIRRLGTETAAVYQGIKRSKICSVSALNLWGGNEATLMLIPGTRLILTWSAVSRGDWPYTITCWDLGSGQKIGSLGWKHRRPYSANRTHGTICLKNQCLIPMFQTAAATMTDFTFVVLRVDFSSRESVRFEVMIDVPIDSTKTGVSTAFWVTFSNPILALLVDWDSRDYGYCVLDTNEPPSTIVFKEWQPSMPESPGFLNHLSPPGPTIGGFIHESNVYAILAWGGALFMGTTYRPSFLTCNRMPPLSNSSNLSPSYLIPVREKDALNGRFHLFLFDASTNHDQREIRRATILGEAIVAGRDMFSFCSLNSLSQEPSPDKTFELTPFRNGGAFSERVGGDMGTGSFLLPSSSGRNAMQVRYQNYAYHSMNLVINRPEGTVVREVKLPAEAQPERYNPSNLGKRIFFDDHLGLIVLGKVGGKIQVLSLR